MNRLLRGEEHIKNNVPRALQGMTGFDNGCSLVYGCHLEEEVAVVEGEGVGDRGLDTELGLEEALEPPGQSNALFSPAPSLSFIAAPAAAPLLLPLILLLPLNLPITFAIMMATATEGGRSLQGVKQGGS